MTKLKDCGSFSGAMAAAIEKLTVAGCGAAINRGAAQIYNYANEDSGQTPTLEQAMALDVACVAEGANAHFFTVYSKKLKYATRHFPSQENASASFGLESRILKINAEIGRVNASYQDATSPGSLAGSDLSINELKALRRLLLDAYTQIDQMDAALAARIESLGGRK